MSSPINLQSVATRPSMAVSDSFCSNSFEVSPLQNGCCESTQREYLLEISETSPHFNVIIPLRSICFPRQLSHGVVRNRYRLQSSDALNQRGLCFATHCHSSSQVSALDYHLESTSINLRTGKAASSSLPQSIISGHFSNSF